MEAITKHTHLFSLFMLLLYCACSYGNSTGTSDTTEVSYFWLSTGIGFGGGRLCTGSDVSLQKGHFYSTLRFERLTWLESDWAHFNTIGVTGGRGFNHRTLYWGGSVGPSFSWGDVDISSENDDDFSGDLSTLVIKRTPGGLLHSYFLFAPFRSLGFGLSTTVVINKYDSYFGVRSTINVGKFGPPIVSRRTLEVCRKKERVGKVLTRSGLVLVVAGSGTALGGLISSSQYEGKGALKGAMASAVGGGTVVVGLAVFVIPGAIMRQANRNRIKELGAFSLVPEYNGVSVSCRF